jgi:hypothetical protein
VPGVYLAREGQDGPIVYVGMAGELRGEGIRGRLNVYSSGKGVVSGSARPPWTARLSTLR